MGPLVHCRSVRCMPIQGSWAGVDALPCRSESGGGGSGRGAVRRRHDCGALLRLHGSLPWRLALPAPCRISMEGREGIEWHAIFGAEYLLRYHKPAPLDRALYTYKASEFKVSARRDAGLYSSGEAVA